MATLQEQERIEIEMAEKLRVLLTVPVEQRHLALLESQLPSAEFRCKDFMEKEEVTKEDVAWAQVILGNVDHRQLTGSSQLQWLQTNSAGVEPYLAPGVLAPGTMLTNASGAYGLAISEHMLGMLLELMKKLHLYRDAQHQQQWHSLGKVTSVYGATVLVLGMGDIGGEFASRCKALGATVIGMRREVREKPAYADQVISLEELDQVLPQADVVAITLPGTLATQNLLCRQRLESMKPGSYLLNVGRGGIVDTEALCDVLERGPLAGAGLDVTQPEPLPPGHRLWSIPNAVVTPHISGFYHLQETHERIIRIFAENCRRFTAGEPLINQVDFATGYRKRMDH